MDVVGLCPKSLDDRFRPEPGHSGRLCMIPIAVVCSTEHNHEMANEDVLLAVGRYLHQDIDIGAKDEIELARNVLALMSAAERTALRKYLATTLGRLSASELKGKLNRATTDRRFSSKGADAFLRAVFSQLEAES